MAVRNGWLPCGIDAPASDAVVARRSGDPLESLALIEPPASLAFSRDGKTVNRRRLANQPTSRFAKGATHGKRQY
jgi:hypothetical protein